jgi:hypothetical protein
MFGIGLHKGRGFVAAGAAGLSPLVLKGHCSAFHNVLRARSWKVRLLFQFQPSPLGGVGLDNTFPTGFQRKIQLENDWKNS